MPLFAHPFFQAHGYVLVRPIAENNLKVLNILLTRRFDGNWEEIAKAPYLPTPLLAAVETGSLDIVNLLIACGAPFAERDLRLAARKGYKEIVELLLEQGVKANAGTLNAAVEEEHREIVELLLARGIETNPHAAAMTGDIATVKEYLEQDAEVDANKSDVASATLRDRYQTLLQIAAGAGQKAMAEYLLDGAMASRPGGLLALNIGSREKLIGKSLYKAAKNGRGEIVALLLDRAATTNLTESATLRNWQRTSLRQTKSPEIARLLLDAGVDINAEDGNKSTPLHLAASRGDCSLVQYLIERGADIARKNRDGKTPLHLAANREIAELLLANCLDLWELIPKSLEVGLWEGRQDVAELLVERGAQLNLSGDIDALLARYAVMGWRQIVELLIDQGADVNHQAGNEFMPLHLAATNGHRDVAECLIDNRALLDAFGGQDGVAPLHCAVWESHLHVVQLLLERGANVNIKRTVGERYWRGSWMDDPPLWSASKGTPLHLVWEKEIAELLIASGADVNARDGEYGRTPLHAVMERFWGEVEEIVELLIGGGADVNATDDRGFTPLHQAIENGYCRVVELLIAGGANLNVTDRNGSTLLDNAVDAGNVKFLQFLIAEGFDINGKRRNNAPTLRALSKGKVDIAEILICSGVDVNLTNSKGETVLHQAAKNGFLNLVELALAADADVNAQDKDGLTPLAVALENSYMEKVNLLIASSANLNLIKNKQGSPLLRELIDRRQTEVAKLLIFNDADVNARDKSDRSVLHCAVQSNWKEIVELLLDNGADINAKRKASFTPLDDALESGNLELAELLVARGALVNKKQVARISALLSLPDANKKSYVNLVAKVQNRSDFSV